MRLKTILYLRTDICSQEITVGGSVTHTLGVINGFKKLGTNVVCASSAMPTILKKSAVDQFIHLKIYPLFFFLRWKFNYLRWQLECLCSSLFFALQVKNLFQQYYFDAIYQRYSILNCTGVILSKWFGIPLILEYNGSEVWMYKNWGEKPFFSIHWIAQILENYNLKHAHYIIVVSEVLKDDLIKKKIAAQKILVNPNGVDPEIFDSEKLSATRIQFRKQFNIQDKFVYGFVGTFSYWHGIELIAKVIQLLAEQKRINVHFLLIGDGPLKPMLETQLMNNSEQKSLVTLTGKIPFDQIPNYLAACDAFICPTQPNSDGTHFFGSPTKLFEYLSMGKPIIASNLEQVAEIINPALKIETSVLLSSNTNILGILTNPNDTIELLKAVCFLPQLKSDVLTTMGDQARKKALQYYTWIKHVHTIQQFVEKNLT